MHNTKKYFQQTIMLTQFPFADDPVCGSVLIWLGVHCGAGGNETTLLPAFSHTTWAGT